MDQVLKGRVRRGQILRALRLELTGLADDSLIAFFAAQGDPVTRIDIRTELDYLAGRGKEYVEFIEKTSSLWLVKLSPKGIDLLDERIGDDPGVVIAR